MIAGGKPITPTGDVNESLLNGGGDTSNGNGAALSNNHYSTSNENGTTVVDGVKKLEVIFDDFIIMLL